MKPFKIIEAQKKVINDLTYKLKFSKNQVKDAEVINTLIDTVNGFEVMMTQKYYTDAIELFMYSYIAQEFHKNKIWDGRGLPMDELLFKIESDIKFGSKIKKLEVISLLKSNELENKIQNNSVFNKNYCNFDEMLIELIDKFKTQIKWTQKK
tara:strand:- start:231 stop:686 length:456 start_codon:yes stop_codon:yes gene_type:complete